MLTEEQFEKIARVYAAAKELDARIAPKPDEMTLEMWGQVVFSHSDYPLDRLMDAVAAYYAGAPDRPLTAGALRESCQKMTSDVIARLSPEEREQFDYQRDCRLRERGFDVDLDWHKPEARKLSRNVQELMNQMGWKVRAIE